MAIHGKRIQIGSDPVDLAQGTGGSATSIQVLTNSGKSDLWVGGPPGEGYCLPPGQQLMGLNLGAVDHLALCRDGKAEPIDVIVGYA